eukprot:841663-Prorocentrum_minimum.AAC.1
MQVSTRWPTCGWSPRRCCLRGLFLLPGPLGVFLCSSAIVPDFESGGWCAQFSEPLARGGVRRRGMRPAAHPPQPVTRATATWPKGNADTVPASAARLRCGLRVAASAVRPRAHAVACGGVDAAACRRGPSPGRRCA